MNEQKKECGSCKNKSTLKNNWFVITLSMYILIATVYGTVSIVKNLISLF